MKKLLSAALAVCLAVCSVPVCSALNTDGFIYTVTPEETVTITGYTDFYTSDVTVPSQIDGLPVTAIDFGVFREKNNIVTVTIPDSVESIAGLVFYNCAKLSAVNFGEGVKSIGANCLSLCPKLTAVDFKNIETIGEFVLYGNKNLTTVIMDKITAVPKRAFSGCKALTTLTFGNSLTSIGDYAFSGCEALTALTFPDSLSYIGNSAFMGNLLLASVTFGASALTISGYAFENCPALLSVNIPQNIVSIGRNAFALREGIDFSHTIAITCYSHTDAIRYCFEAGITPTVTDMENKSVLLGDADGNGTLETDDARIILRQASGIEKASADSFKRGDVNGDGYAQADDASMILQRAIGII